jgi:acetylornithine deacetylase/succinyl-diaminopimelate desuccinylase-like protein
MPQTTVQSKAAAAMNHGARVLIVVGDPVHPADEANYRLFGQDPDAEETSIPVLRARRAEMARLIDTWGLDRIAAEIDADLKPRSKALTGVTIDYVQHLAKNRRTVRNIVAVLPGSNPALAAEAIVIGAHYDHVGHGGRLSVSPERTGEIHNGADDNASGTAAIIEMARAAKLDRARFPRTLVFIAFAGEERGLLGSAFYVTDPAVPVERTIAMLNLDMVGRADGGVDISGLEASPSMEADLKAAEEAARTKLNVRRSGPGAGRSDDSSFIDRGIPAINFFTGFHSDYHRPGDDWEKVDVGGTARVANLALELAARLAARPGRPEFIRR